MRPLPILLIACATLPSLAGCASGGAREDASVARTRSGPRRRPRFRPVGPSGRSPIRSTFRPVMSARSRTARARPGCAGTALLAAAGRLRRQRAPRHGRAAPRRDDADRLPQPVPRHAPAPCRPADPEPPCARRGADGEKRSRAASNSPAWRSTARSFPTFGWCATSIPWESAGLEAGTDPATRSARRASSSVRRGRSRPATRSSSHSTSASRFPGRAHPAAWDTAATSTSTWRTSIPRWRCTTT